MCGQKHTVGKIYPRYQPYPFSFVSEENTYSPDTVENSDARSIKGNEHEALTDFQDLIADPSPPDWSRSKPAPSNDERGLRPLRLLNSLFADRLSFLQRTLEELETAKKSREQLIKYAMDELDPEIQECEVSLSTLKAAQNNTERKRNVERRLFELKRERRREALLSWRDLIWLKGEIRKLQREIDAINTTAGSTENRQPPM